MLRFPSLRLRVAIPERYGGYAFPVDRAGSVACVPCSGVRPDTPTASGAHAAALAQAQGWVQIGYWHSHPAGTPFGPSEVDITDWQVALDTLGRPYLDFPIVTGGKVHVYRLTPGQPPQEVPWISTAPDQTN